MAISVVVNFPNNIDEETIIVFELSAHQLQNIEVSPHIAVLLNIFPEHLDHFDSFAAYEKAKLNVGKYQKFGDKIIVSESVAGKIKKFNSDKITIDETEYLINLEPEEPIAEASAAAYSLAHHFSKSYPQVAAKYLEATEDLVLTSSEWQEITNLNDKLESEWGSPGSGYAAVIVPDKPTLNELQQKLF